MIVISNQLKMTAARQNHIMLKILSYLGAECQSYILYIRYIVVMCLLVPSFNRQLKMSILILASSFFLFHRLVKNVGQSHNEVMKVDGISC